MKKVLVTLVVVFTTLTSAFALNLDEYKVFYKLNNETTFKSLDKYLKLDNNQKATLKENFAVTETLIKSALDNGNALAAEEAMNLTLNNLESVLNEEQYEKFMSALHATISNNREMLYAAK